jgi:metal-responsive CopG/Arc/MetJ family transcriptional regulator
MRAISLKLPEELLQESGRCAGRLDLSRAQYIRKAIEKMNRETRTRFRDKRMAEASLRVREDSMRVNAEFAAIEEDLGD